MAKQFPKNDFQDLERLYNGRASDDVSRLDRKPPRPLWHRLLLIGVGLLVAASVAAWAGFYLFGSYTASQATNLEVNIAAPESVAVGTPFTYHLTLTNKTSDVIQDVSVRINYPEGFLWQSATLSPEGELHNTWSLTALAPGEPKEIAIDGLLFGEPGSVRTVFVSTTYSIPNFRAALQASSSTSTRLDSSPLLFTWEAPVSAAPETELEYKLKYALDVETVLPESTLIIQPPTTFTVTGTNPTPPDTAVLRWPISKLAKGSKGEYILKGRWSKDTNGSQSIWATLQTSSTGTALPIASAEAKTVVSGGDIVLRLTANESDVPAAVTLGSTIHWALTYENTSEQSLSDIEVRVRYDGDLVDWGRVSLSDGAAQDGKAIRWTSATAPTLSKVAAHTKGVLRWDTPVSSVAGAGTMTATPTFIVHKVDEQIVDRTYEGGAVAVPVNTPLTLAVEARYFDDDGVPLGVGPLPPQAKTATTYRLRWKLSGSVHTLRNVVVKASLPEEVRVVEGSSLVSFGRLTVVDARHPVWTIDQVEAGLEPSAEFSVTLTPTDNDVGRIVVISGKTTAEATDALTSGTIAVVGGVATTNLDADTIARGKGVVVK